MTTTTDKLAKKIQKLTQIFGDASNYLQLQNAIDTFNTIKSSVQTSSASNFHTQKSSQCIKLLQTTQQLIKQKIKYFKKKALKKLQSGTINHDHQQTTKIQKDHHQQKNHHHHHKNNQLSHATLLKQSNQKKKKNPNITYDEDDDQVFSQRKDNLKQKKSHPQQSSSSKRLKQSKSVDNLFDRKQKQSITFNNDKQGFYAQQNEGLSSNNKKKVMNQSQFGSWKKNRDKNNYTTVDFDDEKTQIKMSDSANNTKWLDDQRGMGKNKLWRQESVRDEFQMNNGKQYMQKMMEWMYKNRAITEDGGFDMIRRKLGEKVLQLQEVRGRLKYYQNENNQLKKRVLNEQRRQQDYISSLRDKIKLNEQQLYQQDKEKKLMSQLIQQLQLKMQTQQKQIATYSKQLQQALVAKHLVQSQSQSQTNNLKKQLQLLSKHHSSLQDLQTLLSEQKVNNSILAEKNTLLNKQLTQLKQHLVILTNDKNTLQQLLEIKLEEIQSYQQEIYQFKKSLSQQQSQNQNLTLQLQALQFKQAQWQRKKDHQQKRKIQKLKQVKSLLSQQV